MAEARVSGPRIRAVPACDSRARPSCPERGFIACVTAEGVVGSGAVHAGRVLRCRRAIMPRAGQCTLPAGILGLGESAEEGALREATEEARAEPAQEVILAVPSIARLGQWRESTGARSWPARDNRVPA